MRTTIIPAQITTVEDRIAGSFSLIQILILMVPIFATTIIYILLIPIIKLAAYKLILIMIISLISIILAIRIKEKIVAQWLTVLIKYQQRPKYYLFNKNDLCNRKVYLPKELSRKAILKNKVKLSTQVKATEIKLSDLIKLEYLINSDKVAIQYQFSKKGL